MRSKLSILMFALFAAACGQDSPAQGSGNGLRSQADDDRESEERGSPSDVAAPTDAGDFLAQCVRGGGSVGMIEVVFECGSITVYSCKDLSNVVLEFENGERQRFEGLHGQIGTFSGSSGGRIVGVWVKAGSNGSGDGPGYGERFDAPDDECESGQGGMGGAGAGGAGGDCASNDNDPDESCGPLGGAGGAGGNDNGGEPFCPEGDPRCNVD